ncbi:PAS domain S-box protein (plasmid) [Halarchaeum sp. CBA1220]|uniref:PAS domain S-box protein n=1 Tax=Halarchaeum sp. CBA1220 TaxID=1853682 RepID=UPI000F3A8475|nr:PAS domain S-box protein [Halarchaeum sp. CBA1220]QLC34861.1 PAS domain S-box protein [Halarchaeum sp. CBA1220]
MNGGLRAWASAHSWVVVSLLGVLVLLVPLYDAWDDVTTLSWGVTTTAVENAPLVLLALALVWGGFWLRRRDWADAYAWAVAKWTLGITAAVASLYALVIALQLWAMRDLKPFVLALDGVVFGAALAFAIGVYSARQRIARDELARSREEYRTLTDDVLDTSEVATFILDEEFDVVWVNEAVEEYFGIEREAVVGRHKPALVEESIAARFEEPSAFRERVLETYAPDAGSAEFECHLLGGPEREERWLKHSSQPIESGLYAGGRIEHYTDVTAVKRRERQLDLRERKLRELYESISDASLTFEEQVDALIGVGRELLDADYGSFARIDADEGTYHVEVAQSEAGDVAAGDTLPLAETHCRHTVAAERTIQFGTRPLDVAEKAYGTDAGFESYVGTPVYADGTLYGTLCFLDREEADEFDDWQLTMVELMGSWIGYELERTQLLEARRRELREEEAKFEEFVDSVDDYAIFTLDEGGHVTSWNPGAAQIKGYAESEIVGEHVSVFYPEERVEAGVPESLLAEAAETGQAHDEGWRVRKDGTRFWADVTIAARHDADGAHVGYTKVVEDMTEQRERERELEHERERLEFMNRILRHNILNGLNLVGARTDILEDRIDDPESLEHVQTISRRADDLSSLIDTMRTFMDAVVNESEHETYPVSLRAALEEAVAGVADAHPDAVFETHDLPDAEATVVADDLLGEVLENVLENAVVHNDAETPRVEVWVTETTCAVDADAASGDARPDDGTEATERDALCVHVADNGPGIPDEEKASVLRKGVSELSEPGNGFGLYLVTEMMAAYGGAVDVRDADLGGPEEGAAFELVFPRAE